MKRAANIQCMDFSFRVFFCNTVCVKCYKTLDMFRQCSARRVAEYSLQFDLGALLLVEAFLFPQQLWGSTLLQWEHIQ